jgi:hypothetical protein
MSVYRRVCDLREDHDKTQRDIVNMLNMQLTVYQRYERGRGSCLCGRPSSWRNTITCPWTIWWSCQTRSNGNKGRYRGAVPVFLCGLP